MMKGASSQRGGRSRTNADLTGKTSKAKRGAGANWNMLHHMSDAQIHRGIVSDPDVRATDEEFWKDAQVVWPTRETVVTMLLERTCWSGSGGGAGIRRTSTPSCGRI
jgi:hypothetical protein